MNALAALLLSAIFCLCGVAVLAKGRDGWGALFLVLAIIFGASGFTAAV